MKRTIIVIGAACVVWCVTDCQGREIEFSNVTVQVQDEKRQPLSQAQVMAYSDFWWAQYPINGYYPADANGCYTFTLPRGEWTLFAASNNSAETGYFIVRDIVVDTDAHITLCPDSTIECWMAGDVRNTLFYIMDARYSPFVVTAQAATTNRASIVLHVTGDLCYNLVVSETVEPAEAGDRCLLVEKNVPAGCAYAINHERAQLSQLRINTFDGDALSVYPCLYDMSFTLPEVDVARAIGWTTSGATRLFITPGVVKVSSVMRYYSGGQWYYYSFVDKSYTCAAQDVLDLNFGGYITARLKQYDLCPPYHECHPGESLWLDMRDSFDNVLIWASGGDFQGIPVALEKANEPLGLLTIMNPWPMAHMGFADLAESDPVTYQIDFSLGHLGEFHLAGPYLSQDTEYKVYEFATEHFSIYYPEGFQDKASVLANSLETTYQVLADYTGKVLPYRIKVLVVPATFAAWAGDGYIGTSLANFIFSVEGMPLSGFEAGHLHELGHHFLWNTMAWPGLGGEAYASFLGELGLIGLYGDGIGGSYASRGWWNAYFDCLLWKNCSDKVDYFHNQESYFHFALNYLRQVYGDEYHRRFIHHWTDEPRDKTILLHSGYTYDETKVILYSHLAGENLAWLFRPAIDVPENRIEVGLEALTATDIVVNGDFSTHTITGQEFRMAFEGWEIGATAESGDYPRWVWGPTYPGGSEGLLIDSPPPTEVYFQQSIHLPLAENAELQLSVRRCVPSSLTKVFLVTSTEKHLLDTVDTSDLQVWYQDYKTLHYDITSYRGQDVTLRFENSTSEWRWSCTLYPLVRVVIQSAANANE
jgi:hypothetical protein